jgi:hypothetical protein
MKLWAPESYWTDPRVNEVTGGCGPGGIGDWFVPDSIWGVSITEACKRHDWMYFIGKTKEDKEEADRVFLNNMLRTIDNYKGWSRFLNGFRRYRAITYYNAVSDLGGPAFWNDKNNDSEFKEV